MNINELIKKDLLSTRHNSIYDYQFQTKLRDAPWYNWLAAPGYFDCREEYLYQIDKWIRSTKLNSIQGSLLFTKHDLIIGTTQTFDEAYFEYTEKNFRIFRGEYGYHARIAHTPGYDGQFLDDVDGNYKELYRGDWIIISLPFCGTGDVHKHWDTLLDDALDKNVPVIVDCAWFGTCRDIHFDLSHPAITSVSFSLSKGIGLGSMRSGIRYSNNHNVNLPIRQQNLYNHLVLVSAQIGIHQMKTFSPDFTPDKYYDAYLETCEKVGLIPTKCMHVAMAPAEEIWDPFLIDGLYRKVGIRNLVKEVYKGNIK